MMAISALSVSFLMFMYVVSGQLETDAPLTITAADCRKGTHLGTYRPSVLAPDSPPGRVQVRDGHFFMLAEEKLQTVEVLKVVAKVNYVQAQCGNAHHTVLASPPQEMDIDLTEKHFRDIMTRGVFALSLGDYILGGLFPKLEFLVPWSNHANQVKHATTLGSGIHAAITWPTDSQLNQIVCTGTNMYWRHHLLPYMVYWASVTVSTLTLEGKRTPDGGVTLGGGFVLGGGCILDAKNKGSYGACFVPTLGNYIVRMNQNQPVTPCNLRRTTDAPTRGFVYTLPSNSTYLNLPDRKAHFHLIGKPKLHDPCGILVQATNYESFFIMRASPGIVGNAPDLLSPSSFEVCTDIIWC